MPVSRAAGSTSTPRETAALAGATRGALLAAAPALLAVLRNRRARALLGALSGGSVERLPAQLLGGGRHPLVPAALRIERSHDKAAGADQTAVTVWFGEGPALPSVAGARTRSLAMRVGASLLGAAAVAAATTAAARLAEQERPRIVEAPTWKPPVR